MYLNISNQIQQTTLDNGTWRNSPITKPLLPPASDTKLSVSTVSVPKEPLADYTPDVPYVWSILTYVIANSTITATYLLEYAGAPFSNAQLAAVLNPFPSHSLSAVVACLWNIFVTDNIFYTRCGYGAHQLLRGWSVRTNSWSYYESAFLNGLDIETVDIGLGKVSVAQSYFSSNIILISRFRYRFRNGDILASTLQQYDRSSLYEYKLFSRNWDRRIHLQQQQQQRLWDLLH